ncbi:MAG: carbon starvation protein A, partial [Nitrospirae bacterium]|nr:carbon starvation protein A [Nitrospirota bacterium]
MTLFWGGVAIVGAFAFGLVTGFIHPEEKVNALWLVVAAACFFVLAYRFYGAFLAAEVATLNNERITPAIRLENGKDYHPTHR